MGVVGSKRREYRIDKTENMVSSENEEYIEKVVCKEKDIKEGQMKEFDFNEGKILLVRQNGVYSALGSKCTHYGASLINGVFENGVIRCPWHGACFNASNGDIEDFPGLDSLPCYEVSVDGSQVKVKASVSSLKSQKRFRSLAKYNPVNAKTFVVVGGGPAGQTCLETLRQNGFDGKLILITKERHYPYDRPKLSKALSATAEEIYLRKPDFCRKAHVTVMLGTKVTDLNTKEQYIECDKGKLIVKYDAVMIATGGKPRKFNVPGSDLYNICYLRSPDNANFIAKNAVNKTVVIVGSSFIGIEVASALLNTARAIYVISHTDVPFRLTFGTTIGARIKGLMEEKGVIFNMRNISRFIGSNGILSGVQFDSGEVLECDLCVIGIGVVPATNFLQVSKKAHIDLSSRGYVKVNEYMQTNIPNVYACGDIVKFPLKLFNNQVVNSGHFQMACAHGRNAALNMLGIETELRSVPFFWSVICGKSFRFAGYNKGFDDIIIDGDVSDLKFVVYYIKGDNVIAVCSVNRDPVVAEYASNILAGKSVSKNEIKMK